MSLLRITVAVALFALPGHSQTQNRPKAILDQVIQALGGQAFLDVREIETRGRFFQFQRGELSGGGPFVDYIKFPDKERTEFGKKNESIIVNNGEKGWTIENKEIEEQPAGEVESFQKAFRLSFDYILRFVLSDPKTTVQHVGSEIINFKRADLVEIRDAKKNLTRLYIDRDTHLPIKKELRQVDENDVKEEHYSNYHRVGGVMTPLLVVRFTDNVKTMEIRAETVAYNSGLSDGLFGPSLTR